MSIMMCVRCYLEGVRVPIGAQISKDPPFAYMVYEGESRCTSHLPVPAVVNPPRPVPEEFPPLEVVREPVKTDNIYVVEDGTTPKKTAAKKTATKRTPRKRTKS